MDKMGNWKIVLVIMMLVCSVGYTEDSSKEFHVYRQDENIEYKIQSTADVEFYAYTVPETKYVIKKSDWKSCSKTELKNIGSLIGLCQIHNLDAEQYEYFIKRLLPRRFKVKEE